MFLRSLLGAAVLTLSAAAASAAPVVLDAFNDSQLVNGPGTTGQPPNSSFVAMTSPSTSLIRTITVPFGAPDDFIEVDGAESTLTFASPITSLGGLSGSVSYGAVGAFSLDALGEKLNFTILDVFLDTFYGPAMLTLTLTDSLSNSDTVTLVDTFGNIEPNPVIPTNGSKVEILNSYWSGVDTTSLNEIRFDFLSEPFGSVTIGELYMSDAEPGDGLFVVLEPSVVPLPAGVWLLGAGFGALALRRKRRA